MNNYELFLVILLIVLVVALHNIKKNRMLLIQLGQAKKDFEVGERTLKAALLHGGLFYWVYYPAESMAVQSDGGRDAFSVPRIMKDYPESWLSAGLIHPDDIPAFLAMNKKIKDGVKEAECKVREKMGDGYEWRLLKYTVVENDPVTGANIKVLGTDVSIQKEVALEKLYSDRVNYREVLGLKSLFYAKLNLTKNRIDGLFTHMNVSSQTVQNITNIASTADEVLKQVHNHVLKYDKNNMEFQQIDSLDELLHKVELGHTHFEAEFIFNFRGGFSRWVNGVIDVMLNPLTRETECFIYFSDIEAQKFMEQQDKEKIAQALDKAKKANAYKSKFLSRVSHEMRTPLNGILGFCQLGAEEKSLPILYDYLDKIKFSGEMLLNMVNNVLDMDNSVNNTIKLHNHIIDYDQFFSNIKKLILPAFQSKHIEFVLDIKKSDNVNIIADEKRCEQILLNLLSNAVKFTSAGGKVVVKGKAELVGEEKVNLTISVKDNGIGMSEEFQKRVFQPFAQEEDSTTATYQGAGLGMALIKQMLKEMGGNIICHSQQDVGTEFIVTIPATTTNRQITVNNQEIPENPSDILAVLAGTTALVVEDIEINYLLVKKLLENMGVKVEWAQNGQEAVSIITQNGAQYYNFILMDIRMPVMDGINATKAIRNLPQVEASSIPIIALTANVTEEDIEATKEIGMDAHLAKPLQADLLYHTLYTLLK